MCIFHKWSKWEAYVWKGQTCALGILYPKEIRGEWFDAVEKRQRRHCLKCGKTQDELITKDY